MKVLVLLLCVGWRLARGDDYVDDVTEVCCSHGESSALTLSSAQECAALGLPEYIEPEQEKECKTTAASCCREHLKQKDECTAGIKYAAVKRCSAPSTNIAKTCCEECSFGILSGESQGVEACGSPADVDNSPMTYLRKNTYYKCCVEAASKPETTTERKPPTTVAPRQKCKPGSCEQECDDGGGVVRCSCRNGFRLQGDRKTCKDINECAEATENMCIQDDFVCHNTPGSYKCVPIKKRETGLSCPPGFKRNVINQVCDDINECQLPRPPCPKYLCENTIGGYKCGGKPGAPVPEGAPAAAAPAPAAAPKTDICPVGFRAGANDECVDIDECDEHLDDCQRLSQYCINTHGSFFCQDHVSKRCAPGFKVNSASGVCEDIDECEESVEACKRNQVCVNLPGAYDCKSKISTLPKLTTKKCQEGTRMRVGSSICEDIDECREGTHLCDHFQNCINTFGGHECRCKNGFELDSSSGSCVDVDECALKLDNCAPGLHCLNVLGSFTCTRRAATTSTTSVYEYEYYDTDSEDNSTDESKPKPPDVTPTTPQPTTARPTSPKPTSPRPTPPRPTPPKPTTPKPTPRPTTPTPTTTSTTTTPKPTTTSSTTTTTTTAKPLPPYRPSPSRHDPPYRRPTSRPEPRPRYPTPKPEDPRPPLPNVNVPAPSDPAVIETDKDREGGYDLDTGDIPKDKWTNVVGRDKPDDFNVAELHCLRGYEKNAAGDCVDINECRDGRHVCGALERCRNEEGSYSCECVPGFRRDGAGACAVVPTPTTPAPPPPPTTPPPRPTTTEVAPTAPERPYTPPRGRLPALLCEMGYNFDPSLGKCVDINECATNRHTCKSNEKCVNIEGGFQCEINSHGPGPSPARPRPADSVITVGAQYGRRGPRYMRPTFRRLPGEVEVSCPWGYSQSPDRLCMDIDECARNVSECGPQQRCENFYGGYSCQCGAGHRLLGQRECEDIDECQLGVPCSYSSKCINTIGSYRCECNHGFRNAPSNDKVCVDIDECAETPGVCQQGCANSWGSYRCYCDRGYKLDADGKTCVDVDECAEWKASGARGRLCGGECVNQPGSYRCSCPSGYRLSDDQHSCVDIDECETGAAPCARAADPRRVCQNTRGGYHCHTISCPAGYQLEAKHRCTRVQRSCAASNWGCLHQPSTYSYNFITFVANIYLPMGSVDLFTMHGPSWSESFVSFEMRLVQVQAARGVRPADLSCFDTRPAGNVCVVSLLCSLGGPQVVELELTMTLHQRGQFAGSAVARLVVIVSQYEY